MRSEEEISADATDRRPFSNGTMGYGWMGEWCYTCKVDGPFQRDEVDQGCPILLVALLGKTPKEWTDKGLQDYHCSEFVEDDDGDDGDDTPSPPAPTGPEVENPAQVDLFSVLAEQVTEEVAAFVAADQMGVRP
jgi:hypothetical protein